MLAKGPPQLWHFDSLICQVGQAAADWPTGKCDHEVLERKAGRQSPFWDSFSDRKEKTELKSLGISVIFKYHMLPDSSVGRSSTRATVIFQLILLMKAGLLWRPDWTLHVLAQCYCLTPGLEDVGGQLPSILLPQPCTLGHFKQSVPGCGWPPRSLA